MALALSPVACCLLAYDSYRPHLFEMNRTCRPRESRAAGLVRNLWTYRIPRRLASPPATFTCTLAVPSAFDEAQLHPYHFRVHANSRSPHSSRCQGCSPSLASCRQQPVASLIRPTSPRDCVARGRATPLNVYRSFGQPRTLARGGIRLVARGTAIADALNRLWHTLQAHGPPRRRRSGSVLEVKGPGRRRGPHPCCAVMRRPVPSPSRPRALLAVDTPFASTAPPSCSTLHCAAALRM